MSKIILNEKTGFISDSDRVEIWCNEAPFYNRSKRKNKLSFNLPIGIYDVRYGNIDKLPIPIKYKKVILPKPNSVTNFYGKITIIWQDNPNKCSVSLSGGNATFYFDPSFKEYPTFVVIWICGHELAHFLYKGQKQFSEKMCDNYSGNMMKELGYNPSQISAAIELSLSSGYLAKERKKFVTENLLKVQ